MSDIYDQEEGVPQGSILSVTLFSLKINSIVRCLLQDVDCSLDVDDFLICYHAKYMSIIEIQLNMCLDRLQKWCNENGFKFSKKKTVCMHFCHLHKLHQDPSLFLDGDQLPVVEEHKYLGLIFDRNLSFIPHINYLKAKCKKHLIYSRLFHIMTGVQTVRFYSRLF